MAANPVTPQGAGPFWRMAALRVAYVRLVHRAPRSIALHQNDLRRSDRNGVDSPLRAAAGLMLAVLLPLTAIAQDQVVNDETALDPSVCAVPEPVLRYGWKENIRIETQTQYMVLTAKLDTGADTSSLHATHIELYEQGGQNWVRFNVNGRQMEQPIVRRTRIKQKDGSEPQERWVVRLDLCVGKTYFPADFSLVDRSDFSTPALLGRDALEQLGPVDPGIRFTVEPRCAALQ